VSWQGRIFNPDEENVSAGGIFFGFQAPPDDGHPPPDDNEVLFGETTLEAADAADMIASPGAYFVWFTTSAGAIAGEFHIPPPDDG
jgi:hypothetical protein